MVTLATAELRGAAAHVDGMLITVRAFLHGMSQTTQGQPCTLLDLTGTFEATVLVHWQHGPRREGDIHVDKGARVEKCMPLPKKGEG